VRLLAIDIGAGTQDILLLDSATNIENCPKMVMPSPTLIVARRIEKATRERLPLLLSGVTMGGGPNRRALEKHLGAGLKVYATPGAALTFDDDIAEVERLGVTIVSPDEGRRMGGVERVELKDLDLDAVRMAFALFGIEPRFDGLAVAVLDHGEAPPGVSNRLFRFDHLRRVIGERTDLTTFAYLAEEVPPYLTRMRAVARSVDADVPLLLLDTGPAAALGALEDQGVACRSENMIVNLGNAHTLAFHLHRGLIKAFFEHHTRLLNVEKIDSMLRRLVAGTLTHEEVFGEGGHGCIIIEAGGNQPFLAVTGPHRNIMTASRLEPYFAAPYGDSMLAGCFGLVRAFAVRMEGWREEIEKCLGN